MTEIIRKALYDMQDSKYRDFQLKLMPGVPAETVLGVRMPQLRQYAKSLKNTDVSAFLDDLPHKYYDENNLHGFLAMEIKDYETGLAAIEKFLPFVDNWATCDLLRPVSFKKHRVELLEAIRRWLHSEHTYTQRFAMEMLMLHYLDEDFAPEYPGWVAQIRSEEYYIKMMQAWYFATALAKQWEAALTYIENRCLDRWTHNKSIQKAIESYRVSPEHKAYLKKLKI